MYTESAAIPFSIPAVSYTHLALAAISVAGHFKVEREQTKAALAKQIVPGRCQNMTAGTGYVFLIDYAHNEMCIRDRSKSLSNSSTEKSNGLIK